MANIAKNIRLLRTAQNMTQDQLAEALHVTRQTVSNYETGKSQPDIDTIVRLAEALQADPNTLIYGIPTPPERKREYWKTAIAVVVMVLAVVVLQQQETLRQMMMDFKITLSYNAYLFFVKPLCYLVLGFGVMQVLSLFFGLQPCVQKTAKVAIATVVGLWFAWMLLTAVNYVWLDKMHDIAMETTGSFSMHDYWNVHKIPVLGDMATWLWLGKLPAPTFLLPGALLWLFRMKKVK